MIRRKFANSAKNTVATVKNTVAAHNRLITGGAPE